MKTKNFLPKIFKKTIISFSLVLTSLAASAQTNVFDNIINTSPDHTFLAAAIVQENLQGALQNPSATLTVFAPTNAAIENLAAQLGTDVAGVLALDILTDVLLYHVLATTVPSSALSQGVNVVTPLNDANTVKVNLQAGGSVFANHAQVTTPDLTADNGVVHVINEVILPFSTVVDVAIDNGFTYLTAALVQEGLVPALSNPFGTFTVFAPTNTAFDDLAEALNTDIAGLLALENLSAVLLYHVIGSINESGDLVNGNVTTLQGQSVAISIDGGVTVNSSNVVLADVTAFNGVVHVIDAVLLPVDDASINNNNTSKLNIYPNPSTSTFSIAGVEDANLRIVDLTGKEILALQYEGGQINIEALPSGVYFIHVSNKQFNTVQRLIKE